MTRFHGVRCQYNLGIWFQFLVDGVVEETAMLTFVDGLDAGDQFLPWYEVWQKRCLSRAQSASEEDELDRQWERPFVVRFGDKSWTITENEAHNVERILEVLASRGAQSHPGGPLHTPNVNVRRSLGASS